MYKREREEEVYGEISAVQGGRVHEGENEGNRLCTVGCSKMQLFFYEPVHMMGEVIIK